MVTVTENLLEIQNLNYGYRTNGKRIELLHDLSLEIAPGTITVFSGRSGSGKSSLLQLCYGLRTPDSGTVSWFHKDVNRMTKREKQRLRREKIGYLPQETTLFDELSVLRNVLVGGAATAAAQEMLSGVGLGDYLRRTPKHMSGGERQRVTLVRALAKQPSILILDEPTSALDIVNAEKVAQLLLTAKANGSAVILGTHDEVLLEIADEKVQL